jgi:arylsulfatase A-like enzyme
MTPTRPNFLVCALLGVMLALAVDHAHGRDESAPPNIVLIYTDDQGYGDVGCFGAADVKTPSMDRLATEGRRFTSFYVAQAVCTASRAALMSGCYPTRVSMAGALNHTSTVGIHPDEWLLPEMLKDRGYATIILGKWHLGTVPEFAPLENGFDQFLGIPYSNDNTKYHPVLHATMPPLPLYDGREVIEQDPDQALFTKRFTERAVAFIEAEKDRPFFLYIPHVMPHVPIFASGSFEGTSARGLYGDVIEELDWSVGQVLAALEKHGLDEQTLVIFMSDNGPFLSYGEHAGSSGPLREGKLTTFEGGVRTPCLMRWPGTIPAGTVCDAAAMTIDLLPTIAGLVGGTQPERTIDGEDIRPLLTGDETAASPHKALVFYAGGELQAVRSGRWKLHFEHDYLTVAGEPGRNGKPSNFDKLTPASITQSGIHGIASRHGYKVAHTPLALYDLEKDPGEQHNLATRHPDVVQRLASLAEPIRAELGDRLSGVVGTAIRPAGNVAEDR